MAQSDELLTALLAEREAVLIRLGAAERRSVPIRTNIEADYEATPYAGMDDRGYPLWQSHKVRGEWIFVLDAELTDYGYAVDEQLDDEDFRAQELPKATSEYEGKVRYSLEFIDRFAGRLTFRGFLNGASFELGLDILLRLSILGYRHEGPLGYAGETLAEGYAFELEQRWKQAFFCYFSALESLLDVHRGVVNRWLEADKQIPENERLRDKLSKVTASQLLRGNYRLNEVGFWTWLRTRFITLEELRNAIAHNEPHTPVDRRATAETFVIFAVVAALLDNADPDVTGVLRYFAVPHRGARKQRWEDGDD